MTKYAIYGGLPGKQRLDVLNSVMRPHTPGLLDRAGVGQGARCLDAGSADLHAAMVEFTEAETTLVTTPRFVQVWGSL